MKKKNGQDLGISRTGPWNIADRTLEYPTRTGPWNIQRGQDPGISRTGPWNIADRTLDIIGQIPGRQSPTYHIKKVDNSPELFEKMLDLCMILSKNYK